MLGYCFGWGAAWRGQNIAAKRTNIEYLHCIQQGLFFEALHYIFSRMTSINPSDIPQADELINIVSDLRNQYINFLEIREDEYKVLEENVLSSLLNNMDTENQSTTSGTASSFSASVDNKNHIDVLTYKDKQVLFSSTEAQVGCSTNCECDFEDIRLYPN